jgi:hypothetical protein
MSSASLKSRVSGLALGLSGLAGCWLAPVAAEATTSGTPAATPAPPAAVAMSKKALAQRIAALQTSAVENMSRHLVERPAAQVWQAAQQHIAATVPPEQREALTAQVKADIQLYVNETTPKVRERAMKMAPNLIAQSLEAKLSEEELRQLLTWLESTAHKKYQSLAAEMQDSLGQKLVSEAAVIVDPRLKALDQKVRAKLGLTPPNPKAKSSP